MEEYIAATRDEMEILKAGWEAMTDEPWDESQAVMMGAVWDAMRKAASVQRETGWLIERNDLAIFPVWYWEDPYRSGWHSWTKTAKDAKRFATREDAEAFGPYQQIASDPHITLTEHVFL